MKKLIFMSVLLFILIIVGCNENKNENENFIKDSRKEVKHNKVQQRQAVALKGCIIIEQEGSRMVYKRKCGFCGYISASNVITSIPGKNTRTTSGFKCSKCKKYQKIEILGIK